MNMDVWRFGLSCVLALTAAPTFEVRAVQTPATPTGVLTGIVVAGLGLV